MSKDYIDVKGWGRLLFWNKEPEDVGSRMIGGVIITEGTLNEDDEDQIFHGRFTDSLPEIPEWL